MSKSKIIEEAMKYEPDFKPTFRQRMNEKIPSPFLEWIKYGLNSKYILFPPRLFGLSYSQRVGLAYKFIRTTINVDCLHTREEITEFANVVLSMTDWVKGDIAEAGTCKGGSTAKFSLIAKLVGREMFIFDSFEGLPDNEESKDKSVLGHTLLGKFAPGRYKGDLEEVKDNVRKYGDIEVCTFIKGWFNETMPSFKRKLCAIYMDVDLASSTKTCLENLYPQLSKGGVVFSQDGDFPLIINLLDDEKFWNNMGYKKPTIEGLGKKKLLSFFKED